MEQQEKDDVARNLEDMDLTWEQRKDLERMKAEKKRGRMEDNTERIGKRKRMKRMRFTTMGDNWGEEC